MKVEECKVPEEYICCSFNPRDDNMMVVLTKTAIYINEIQKTYRPTEDGAVLYYETVQRYIELVESQEFFSVFAWHHDETFFFGTEKGTWIQFNPKEKEEHMVYRVDTDSGIKHFILTQLHVITVNQDK